MMHKKSTAWITALSCALVAGGFLLPLWPLSVAGIILAALSGRWLCAVLLGLLLDSAYGAPIGRWHFIYFPFTLAALVGIGVYYYTKANVWQQIPEAQK